MFLEAIIFIAAIIIIFAVRSYKQKERDELEKRVQNLREQKYALARIIMFLIDVLPDEREKYKNMKHDIKSMAEGVVAGYTNDEDLEKELTSIRVKIKDLIPIF